MNRFSSPRGSPPAYMSRVYRSNLRPFILFGAVLALLWSLISGISSFRNVPFLNNSNEKKLGVLYIVLGALFMGMTAIEAFGIFAVATQRLLPVRTFSYLSILVTLMVAATYIIQTIVHYSFKNDIINLCSNANSGDHIIFIGFFGPVDGGVVTPAGARAWCTQQFNRSSFSNIVALLVTTAVAAIFAMFVFAYLRQLRDPSSAVNVSREPVYNPTYNPAYNPAYPAPNGPPPGNDSDAFVPPYGAADKPPGYNSEGDNFKRSFGDSKDPFENEYPRSGGGSTGYRPY